jgi:hypothetical protein
MHAIALMPFLMHAILASTGLNVFSGKHLLVVLASEEEYSTSRKIPE